MNSRLVKFSLLSLAFHALGFAVLQSNQVFEGAAPAVANHVARSVMIAGIVPAESTRAPALPLKKPEYSKSPQSGHIDAMRKAAVASGTSEANPASAQMPASGQDYFAAGELTRLPVPVTDIDLDVADVKEVAVGGAVSLTILIDADGKVVDVSSANEDGKSRIFSERVAEIFKRARFAPGEVNGRAVKARLEINVVSEDIRSL